MIQFAKSSPIFLLASGCKIAGLALAIDLLSGGLSGGGCSNIKHSHHGNAAFFLVIKVDPFVSKDEFVNNFIDLKEHIKDSRLASGFDKIYFPGEIERENKKNNKSNGVEIDEVTIEHLRTLAKEKGIRFLV